MFFNDDEKDARKEALDKLMSMMDDESGKRLGGLKKPVAASMTIEKMPEDMGDDDDKPDGDMGMNDNEDSDDISDDDKARITELYHKYC